MNLPQPHALHTALLEHPDALLVVRKPSAPPKPCLLYTSDAADE